MVAVDVAARLPARRTTSRPAVRRDRRPGRPRLHARRGGGARACRPRRTTCAPSSTTCSTTTRSSSCAPGTRPTSSPGSAASTGAPSASSPTSRCSTGRQLDIDASRRRRPASCSGATASTSRSSPSSTRTAIDPGRDLEWRGIIRHGAQLLHAYAAATVPRLCVVLRKAYGGAYIVMDSKGLGNDWCVAWPTAEIAVMGAPPARCRSCTGASSRRSTTTPSARRRAARARRSSTRSGSLNPYVAAERGYVDDVIAASDTRRVLAAALERLSTKREHQPRPPSLQHTALTARRRTERTCCSRASASSSPVCSTTRRSRSRSRASRRSRAPRWSSARSGG